MAVPITLDRVGCSLVLLRLAQSKHPAAPFVYARLMQAWGGTKADRTRVTLKVHPDDLELLQALELPRGIRDLGMLQCGWLVTYRHPRKPNLEVVVYSITKPLKKRTFNVAGGKQRLVAVSVERINKEEVPSMATRSRSKKKAPEVDEDELDELEVLEDLDDLEDEDVEDEEPEDEEEDDEEEEEPAPKRSRKKAPAKKAPAKRSRKKAAEPEDDEDDEDEDDEDEEPAPKKRSSKSKAAPAKKAPAKKGSAKRQPPSPKPLPAGRLSPADIAEEAGVDARTVRIFLRAHEDEFPKDEDSFRYSFTKKEAARLIKAIKNR